MSNFLSISLKLGGDPRQIQTKTGTPMVTGFGFAKLGNDSPDLSLGVVAFYDVANELANYKKGDVINLSGQLKINVYEKNGQEQQQLQILADGLAGKLALKQVKNQRKQYNTPATANHQSNPAQNNLPAGNNSYPNSAPNPTGTNQYQGDMGFQQNPNQPAQPLGQPTAANSFQDDDIQF